MSYQALLFCPDEKTARVVTQVLTELDFTVEPCNEPFAAVKKLMAQHFDAVVVDCDNEQNATLLFKSARNSGINQSSLSVAVVEGQAGVAKAFRIGANLVLTKPINVEQSKGTLRVARGLLRKGEVGAKSASESPSRPAVPAPVMGSPKTEISAPEPPIFTAPKISAAPPPSMARSSSFELEAERTPEPEPMEAAVLESMPDPAPTSTSNASKEYPWQPMNKLSEPMASALKRAAEVAGTSKPSQELAPESGTTHQEVASPTVSSWGNNQGTAAAPAPAKETTPAPKTVEFKAPANPVLPVADEIPAPPQFEAPIFSTLAVKDHEQAVGEEGKKRPFLWVAVAAIMIAGIYFGWTKIHTVSSPAPVPSAEVQSQAPAATQPSATVIATPLPSTGIEPSAAPTSQVPGTKPAKPSPAEPTIATTAKSNPEIQPVEREPLVVKKDQPQGARAKVAEVEAPEAPAALGLGGSADKNAISGIVASAPVAVPTAAAHTIKVSQGVSQGLITKRVQPAYPPQALQMRLQGEVQLQAQIGKDGSISSVKVLKGDSILSRAAVAAVKQWKYKPYFLNGEPVAVETEVTVNFKLP